MDKVYVIMFIDRIMENSYYTDQTTVAKRVKSLNEAIGSEKYWYQTLDKF